MTAVGLFDAKTHLSEYVARAQAGEEVVIMRHNKPVAKIVPIVDTPALNAITVPRFVQKTFHLGATLVDLTKLNQLAGDLEDEEFLKLTARLAQEAQGRQA